MKYETYETHQAPRVLIVGVHTPYHNFSVPTFYFDEFKSLLRSQEVEYVDEFFCKVREIDKGYFLTKGKREELQKVCEELEIEQVIFSEPLSAQQERNLSLLLNAAVFDRTQLILDIFERGAVSAEGKLQVELALLQHKKSRLAGRGISMSQQAGYIGGKGPGETQKEKDMRHLETLITRVERELERLERVRNTQRKQRLQAKMPLVSLIGYTNAGKSTLLNLLTKSNVLAVDRLFATLDTTTRELYLGEGKKALLSDTVGFIRYLPHTLIRAFNSTLSELRYADLLLHVVDASDPQWQDHIEVVNKLLTELEVKKPIIYIFNKMDQVEYPALEEKTRNKYTPHILLSATHDEDAKDELLSLLNDWYEHEYTAA